MKKILQRGLVVLALLSLIVNFLLIRDRRDVPWYVYMPGANSHRTYFSIHNVAAAHQISRGKGIKVGILDHYFGCENRRSLYSGCQDFLNDAGSLNQVQEHGFWMASTLREIAPDCEIYALNTLVAGSEDRKISAMIAAIEWAVAHRIDILTYSDAPISEKNRGRLDAAVERAVRNNIVTTFIHYDHPANILPNAMRTSDKFPGSRRKSDVSIYPYDYSTLFLGTYKRFSSPGFILRSGDDIPYFSQSSTSVVTAGFVALLKGVNNALIPQQYREILAKTSRSIEYSDYIFEKKATVTEVPDVGSALEYLNANYK